MENQTKPPVVEVRTDVGRYMRTGCQLWLFIFVVIPAVLLVLSIVLNSATSGH